MSKSEIKHIQRITRKILYRQAKYVEGQICRNWKCLSPEVKTGNLKTEITFSVEAKE